MAIYGVSYYGTGVYGTSNFSVAYSAEPFTSASIGYNTINLSWNVPTSSTAADWSLLKLVRNKYGFPLSIEDGDVILTATKSGTPNTYTDKGQVPNNVGLQSGAAYYYSIFVYSTTLKQWQLSGQVSGVSVKQYNGQSSYDMLPNIYKTTDLTSGLGGVDNTDLQSYLNIFDFYLDFLHTHADFAWNTYDINSTYYPLLPVMFQQFGLKFEPELGYQRSRAELANVALINQLKGSTNGISNYIKTFSAYEPIINVNNNLMLSYDDSSFESGVGHWNAFDTSITGPSLNQWPITNETPSVPPFQEGTLVAVGSPNSNLGVLQVELNYPEDAEFACGYTDPKNQGIPITAGSTYTFSMYTFAGSTPRSIGTKLYWFDQNGVSLGASSEVKVNNTTGYWGTRLSVTGVAPGFKGSVISAAVTLTNVATLTLSANHNLTVGSIVKVSAIGAPFDGSQTITAVTSNTISYAVTSTVSTAQTVNGVIISATTSPAYYAVPSIKIYGGVGSEYHYFDAGQFELGSSATLFKDARGLLITLKANRVNEITNPSFVSGIAPWTVTNGTALVDLTNFESDTSASYQSAKLTATSTSPLTFKYDNYIPILGGLYYTLSAYVQTNYTGIYTSDKLGYMSISWYDSSNALINTVNDTVHPWSEYYTPTTYSISGGLMTIYFENDLAAGMSVSLINFVSGINGNYSIVSTTVDYITVYVSHADLPLTTGTNGELIQNKTGDFSRFSYSQQAPNNAAYAKAALVWSNPTTGTSPANNLWVDSVLFEQASVMSDYFDGSGGFSSPSDLFWEGTVAASRSHYYRNYTSSYGRLKLDLPNYVMNGTTFRLLIAQPGVLG